MRKFQLDGKMIKQLRDARPHASTQKEFAHEIRVSERHLRASENEDAPVALDVAERIARALGKPFEHLLGSKDFEHRLGSASNEPRIPPNGVSSAEAPDPTMLGSQTLVPELRELLPRFDKTTARAMTDEASLVELVRQNWVLIPQVLTKLSAETSNYAEELISILGSLADDPRAEIRPCGDGAQQIALRRRVRELLVLLKGNDIWVYGADNMKRLPESNALQPADQGLDLEFQAIVAFGPPGEFGETSVDVSIDRGQPIKIIW
jgi:DNA-binding XRE family transcriptional regulator